MCERYRPSLSSIVSADSESVKLRTSPIAATLPPLTANLTTPLEPLVVAMLHLLGCASSVLVLNSHR